MRAGEGRTCKRNHGLRELHHAALRGRGKPRVAVRRDTSVGGRQHAQASGHTADGETHHRRPAPLRMEHRRAAGQGERLRRHGTCRVHQGHVPRRVQGHRDREHKELQAQPKSLPYSD